MTSVYTCHTMYNVVNYFCEFVHDAQMLVGAGSGVAVDTDVENRATPMNISFRFVVHAWQPCELHLCMLQLGLTPDPYLGLHTLFALV